MADTLLDLVQDVLNEMDSDAINTITDSQEADQVANLFKSVYDEMVIEFDFPHTAQLSQLVALADVNYLNYMQIPERVSDILWVKYKDGDTFKDVNYLTPVDFLDKIMGRDPTLDSIVTVTDHSGIPLYIREDRAPKYWTSFDNEHLVFDSIDTSVDVTLQASKSACHAYVAPTLAVADGTIPDMPVNLIPLLKQEVLARASVNYKQVQNPKAETSARRMRVRSQRNKWRTENGGPDWPDYGRK